MIWPGIDSINFNKVVGPTIPAAKVHLNQERQGLQSTKIQIKLEDAHNDAFPPQSKPKTQEMGITITSVKNIAYSDLTGQFPHISSRGHTYLLTIYDYDANDILAGTLKIRQAKEIATVWKKRHLQLTKNGHEVKYYIMDNECSQDLQQALKNNDVDYQLVPYKPTPPQRSRTCNSHI